MVFFVTHRHHDHFSHEILFLITLMTPKTRHAISPPIRSPRTSPHAWSALPNLANQPKSDNYAKDIYKPARPRQNRRGLCYYQANKIVVGTCLWHVLFGRQAIMCKCSELYMPSLTDVRFGMSLHCNGLYLLCSYAPVSSILSGLDGLMSRLKPKVTTIMAAAKNDETSSSGTKPRAASTTHGRRNPSGNRKK